MNYQTSSLDEVAVPHKDSFENENLLRLARKRVNERQRLNRHLMSYFGVSLLLFVTANMSYRYDFLAGTLGGIWIGLSVLMVSNVTKYFIPRIRLMKKDPIKAEYEKLKRMGYDEVAREFRKM